MQKIKQYSTKDLLYTLALIHQNNLLIVNPSENNQHEMTSLSYKSMWPLLKKLYKRREVFIWLLMSINALMRNNLKRGIGKSIARSETRIQATHFYVIVRGG